jgi:hypothetical protein
MFSFSSRSSGEDFALDPSGSAALFFFSVVPASPGAHSDSFWRRITEEGRQICPGRGFGRSITSSQMSVESLWVFSSL